MNSTPIATVLTSPLLSIELLPTELLSKEQLIFKQVDPAALPLVDKFYHSQGYKIKCGRNERVFTLSHPLHGHIVAARLLPQAPMVLAEPNDYWLRNLLVVKSYRKQGLGNLFMQKLLSQLETGDCYCFALTHLEQFYLDLGFQHLQPEGCNASVAKRYLQYRARGRDWLLMGYRT